MLHGHRVNQALFAILLDILSLLVAMLVSQYLRNTLSFNFSAAAPEKFPLLLVIGVLIIWSVFFVVFSVHVPDKNYRLIVEVERLLLACFFAMLTMSGTLYFLYRDISRLLIVYFFLTSTGLMLGWRLPVYYARHLLRYARPVRRRPVIIVGSSEIALQVAEHIQEYAWVGLDLRGLVDDRPPKAETTLPILGSIADLRRVVLDHGIEEVVIALRDQSYDKINGIVVTLHELPVRVRVVPSYFSLALFRATVEDFGGIPLINLREPALSWGQRLVKRLFDLVVGSLIGLCSLPVMALVAVAIRLDSPGPILFKQERIGENGKPFIMYKFRSMHVDAEKRLAEVVRQDDNGNILYKSPDDPRVTRVGRFIRRTSLDELPQIFNVLKGEMSLVGPRPELPWLVERYESWQCKRFAVPQGITGWWQVNGRSNKPMHLSTEDDLYYIQNYSLLLDIVILWKTLMAVLKRRGAF